MCSLNTNARGPQNNFVLNYVDAKITIYNKF